MNMLLAINCLRVLILMEMCEQIWNPLNKSSVLISYSNMGVPKSVTHTFCQAEAAKAKNKNKANMKVCEQH